MTATLDYAPTTAAHSEIPQQPERRNPVPFGGLTPSEAGKRGAISRRQAKAEAAVEPDVSAKEVRALKRRLLELAQGKHNASPTAQIQAARELKDWVKLTSLGDDVDDPARLTREERQAERDRIAAERTRGTEPA